MQGLPVLTLLLHVIVLAQCQYCSCIYILLPRNSVFSLNSSRTTFPILAAVRIYLREIILKSLLKICPILSIQILDSRPYFIKKFHHFSNTEKRQLLRNLRYMTYRYLIKDFRTGTYTKLFRRILVGLSCCYICLPLECWSQYTQ